MEITESMLQAAVRKATEAGLLSRRCTADEAERNRAVMRAILKAALELAEAEAEAEQEDLSALHALAAGKKAVPRYRSQQ